MSSTLEASRTSEPPVEQSEAVSAESAAPEEGAPQRKKWASIELGFFERCEAVSTGAAPPEEASRVGLAAVLPRRLTRLSPAERLGAVAGIVCLIIGAGLWVRSIPSGVAARHEAVTIASAAPGAPAPVSPVAPIAADPGPAAATSEALVRETATAAESPPITTKAATKRTGPRRSARHASNHTQPRRR